MKKTTFSILLLLLAKFSYAQNGVTKTSFSLQEAVAHALTHNRNIQNASLGIQAAEEKRWETITMGLPQINGKIDYKSNIVRPIEEEGNPIIDFFIPKHSITPSVTLSQLIFDGSYIVGLKASKVFLEISKNYKEKTENEIEIAVVNAYTTAQITKENIAIIDRNIASVKENLKDTKAIYENGLTEEESVEQLSLTLADLENSRKNLVNANEVAQGMVKLLLGIPATTNIKLYENLETLIANHSTLEGTKTTHSVFNNIDYKIALNDVKSKELLYQSERSKYLPSVTGFVSGNYQGINSRFGDLFNHQQEWLSTVVAGVSINFPIFTSFKIRSKKRQAKINWDSAINNLKDTEQKLSLDIKNAQSNYILALETYENRRKNLSLAEKIERKNTVKFKEGLTSSIALRQVQMQLYGSQQEYLKAISDVINTKVILKNTINLNK
ncbi:MAG: TolC family protein [Flavicella sp.]